MVGEAVRVEEVYAHSLSTLRRLGGYIVEQAVDHEVEEVQDLAYDDFKTALAEMLKTDPDFRDDLDVDNERDHQIEDGRTLALDGTPISEVLKDGLEASKQAAATHPEFIHQVNRDECDLFVVDKVNQLEPGQTFIGISFDPKLAIKLHPELYVKQLGYREGLIYIQEYSKVDENTLFAGSYSVDHSDSKIWRELLNEHGFNVPEDVTDDTWLLHGRQVTASPEQAKDLVEGLRKQFYERIGKPGERQSVTEYIEQNDDEIRQMFDIYYPALSEAAYTGNNSPILQNLASSLLSKDLSKLKPEFRKHLIVVANSSKFDDESARAFDSVLRYAVVEVLRGGLSQFVKKNVLEDQEPAQAINFLNPRQVHLGYVQDIDQINNLLANNVQKGVKAGRSYGGCAGQIELSLSVDAETDQISSLQEAFGGVVGRDKHGSLKFTCSNGHVNTRRRNELLTRCQHSGCNAQVCCSSEE